MGKGNIEIERRGTRVAMGVVHGAAYRTGVLPCVLNVPRAQSSTLDKVHTWKIALLALVSGGISISISSNLQAASQFGIIAA